MSLAYHRFKMKATAASVSTMRSFCDGCVTVLNVFAKPIIGLMGRVEAESPWVVVVIATTLISAVPILSYPLLKPYFAKDERALLEEERVRLCLQKGIDPYPYLTTKDLEFGRVTPSQHQEDEVPKVLGNEQEAMAAFDARKEELLKELGGDPNTSLTALMALREKRRQEMASSPPLVEPKHLTFWGRPDVNQLKS